MHSGRVRWTAVFAGLSLLDNAYKSRLYSVIFSLSVNHTLWEGTMPHLRRPVLVRFVRLCAVLLIAVAAFGQITTTGIHGIVRDPSGAVVPNANITLRDLGTGIENSTVSTGEGNFAFATLQAASYRLTAAAPGFQTAVIDKIQVDSGRITDVAVQMTI